MNNIDHYKFMYEHFASYTVLPCNQHVSRMYCYPVHRQYVSVLQEISFMEKSGPVYTGKI